jgi:hypothetical protein
MSRFRQVYCLLMSRFIQDFCLLMRRFRQVFCFINESVYTGFLFINESVYTGFMFLNESVYGRHDIAEILLKVALNTKNLLKSSSFELKEHSWKMILKCTCQNAIYCLLSELL